MEKISFAEVQAFSTLSKQKKTMLIAAQHKIQVHNVT